MTKTPIAINRQDDGIMPASSDSIYIMVSTLMNKETKLKTRASFFMLFPFPYTVKPLVSSRLENLYKTTL